MLDRWFTFIVSGLVCAGSLCRAQDHGARVYEQVSGAVAWVQSVAPDSMTTLRGSGVVLKDRRWLVSNYHVWKNGGVLSARLGDVPLRLGRTITADKERDVLVVEVLGTTPESAWAKVPTLHTANADALKPGMDAYAVGNPRGVELTISYGLVSGLRPNLNDTAQKLIQFSAPISEGNSGGALVDARGTLIGIPTVWFSDGGGQALNFAIPIERVIEAAEHHRNDVPAPDERWLRGVRLYRNGYCQQATDTLVSVVSGGGPFAQKAAYLIARCFQRGGHLKEARAAYESILASDPTDALTCYRLGEVLYAQGETMSALEYKARAVKLNADLATGSPAY